ncbi:hypothetical protein BGZ75_005167 [Mortierella antarctica]|nr:hypothetical protein BGZ75_005167 [Mortierella antarctica]
MELKKAIASVRAKLEEASARLQKKEEELTVLREQLETGSCLETIIGTDTASSDGGETVVQEMDLSKLADQDKEIVVAAIAAKEKEVAKKKHQLRSLKARVERLRIEYEQTIKNLIQEHHEHQAGQDAKLTALRQELAQAFKIHADTTTPLRQKLDESLALHATTVDQLNRIHDDKLHCLELELHAAKAEQLGRADVADQEVQERYRLDLEDIKRTHQQEVEQLLNEHQEEVDAVNANFEVLKKQATEEYEAELRERFDSELAQINASHASQLDDRKGADGGMIEMLQNRHVRALSELTVKAEKEHNMYLNTLQNKQKAAISSLVSKHKERSVELESKIKKLKTKHETDVTAMKAKADTDAKKLKQKHASEITKHKEQHAKKLKTVEGSTKDNMQRELDAVQKQFSTFVGETQGTLDTAMRTLEGGYETRIAELIVTHENRVQELENAANEQVQEALERVETEFESDQERLKAEHVQRMEELRTRHEAVVEDLEDRLSKAEDEAKKAVETTKKLKKDQEVALRESRADLEAQLNAVMIAIEEQESNHKSGQSASETLKAESAASIAAKTTANEKALKNAVAKKEATWQAKQDKKAKEIHTIRTRLTATQSEADKARRTLSNKEARLKTAHTKTLEAKMKEHAAALDTAQKRGETRLSDLRKTHERHANAHEGKLADLVSGHNQQLEAIQEEQEALLKARDLANQNSILTLQQRVDALKAQSGSTASRLAQDLEQTVKALAELKVQNEVLKDENEQLVSMLDQLQDAMVTRA